MVQVVPQSGGLFGRIGKGFGEGLSEQIPKEVDRYRLSKGLQKFEKESANLTPMQQLTRLAAIPGALEHPELIKSVRELAKNQNVRNIYNNKEREEGKPVASAIQKGGHGLEGVQFANLNERRNPPIQSTEQQNIPSNYLNEEAEATSARANPVQNELGKQFEPIPPWSTQRMEDTVGYYLNRDPNLSLDQAYQLASQEEERERALPAAEREVNQQKKATQNELDSEIDSQLSTALEKEGKDIYADVSGESLLNLKKSAFDDLSTNPKLNANTAATKWIKKAKHLAETKSLMKKEAHRDIGDRILPGKKEETLKRLMSASKIYAETGNSNEFYNMLKTKNSPLQVDAQGNVINPERYGFDLSPGGAALIAYPRSEPIKKIIKENKSFPDIPVAQNLRQHFSKDHIEKTSKATRKFAQEVGKNLRAEDSILAIAKEMKENNPYFNENIYFDYFRDNQNNLGLTPHMKQELTEGVSDIIPNWGDIFLFPAITRSVAND